MSEPAPALEQGYTLVALDRVGSTNEEARRRAAEGALDGTVVWAKAQDAGRGRRARAWISEPGNLYCSVIVRPDVPVAEASQFGFVAGLAIAAALEDLGAPEVACKWPNDVLISGRKAAGLLLESAGLAGAAQRLDWLVVGIGINVAHHPEGTEFPATSLAAAGIDAPVERVLAAVTRHFARVREGWERHGFAPLRTAWLGRAFGLGGPLTARLADGETLSGRFAGLAEDGALMLEVDGACRHIMTADVFFG